MQFYQALGSIKNLNSRIKSNGTGQVRITTRLKFSFQRSMEGQKPEIAANNNIQVKWKAVVPIQGHSASISN